MMVFGCFPFDSKSNSEVLDKIVKDPHKFPSNISISKSCINLLNGLLDKNQHYRIETNDALYDEWYNDE
jgi:serine/threonine protein kinase